MAVSAQQDNSEIYAEDIDIDSSTNKVSSPKVSNKLSGNFVHQARALWFSGFALLNLAVFHLLLSMDLFGPNELKAREAFSYIQVLFAVVLLWACGEGIFRSAVSSLKKLQITQDVCMSVAFLLSGLFPIYAVLFQPDLLEYQNPLHSFILFAFTVTLVSSVYRYLDKKLNLAAGYKLSDYINSATLVKPEDNFAAAQADGGQGVLFPPDVTLSVAPSDLRPGDIVLVKKGEFVPCDGIIEEGEAELAERQLSGTVQVRLRAPGSEVYAGSKVVDGEVQIKVTTLFQDCFATEMEDLLDKSVEGASQQISQSQQVLNLTCMTILFLGLVAGQYWLLQEDNFEMFVVVTSAVLSISLLTYVFELKKKRFNLLAASAFRAGALARSATDFHKFADIETFAVHYDPDSFSLGLDNVVDFKLLDSRVDRDGLISAMISILSKSRSDIYARIIDYLKEHESARTSFELKLEDFNEYDELGICAVLSGADFSIGTEDFLLERGVILQSTEASFGNEDLRNIYVAVGEEVVAKFTIEAAAESFSDKLLQCFRSLDIRPIFVSSISQDDADRIGKFLGFELPDIFGDLNAESFSAKISAIGSNALLQSQHTDKEISNKSDVSISFFDTLLRDCSKSDITLFGTDLSVLKSLLKIALLDLSVFKANLIVSAIAAIGLFLGAVLGYLAPAVIVSTVAILSILLMLNTLRISRATI